MSVLSWQYKTYDGDAIPIYIAQKVKFSYTSLNGRVTVERVLEIDNENAWFCVHWNGQLWQCVIYFDGDHDGETATITCTDVYTQTPSQSGTYLWPDRPATFMNVQLHQYTLGKDSSPTWPNFYFGEKHLYRTTGLGTFISSTLTTNIYLVDRVNRLDSNIFCPAVPPYSIGSTMPAAGSWDCYNYVTTVIYAFWGSGEHVNPDSHNPDDDQGGDGMIGPGVKSGLFSVYVPTDFNMNRFTNWLWGTGFDISQLKKLFNDPMESIISLHAIYMSFPSEGTSTIHLGNLDSEIGCPYTTDTIKTISCGSISVDETFQNVLDYDPYTKVEIFLPYIGFKPLKATELMNGSISVSYKVDIVTGACVALVSITKNNNTMVAYSYSGNCAIALPITGANYREVIANITSTALSVGTAIATGGATAPMAVGAVGHAALGSQIHVERSGAITSNTGMLGENIPYLIVTRPVEAQPTNFEQYYGFPASQLTLLSACSGFTRVKECHLSINATEKEKEELETILKTGIII